MGYPIHIVDGDTPTKIEVGGSVMPVVSGTLVGA